MGRRKRRKPYVYWENMPRPGIEPGLEVPETSVMSFSLPGHRYEELTEVHQRCVADNLRHRHSIQNRGQVWILRFVVEADRHQGHLLHQAESFAEAPAEQIAVARGYKKARAEKSWCRRDEGLQRIVRFSDRVAAVSDSAGVADDGAVMLDDRGHPVLDRVAQIAPAIVAVGA